MTQDKQKCEKCEVEMREVGEVLVNEEVRIDPMTLQIITVPAKLYQCPKCKEIKLK